MRENLPGGAMRAESQAAAHFQVKGDREPGSLPHLLLLLIRFPDHTLCGKVLEIFN
jgi:hypothetical protein